MKETQHIPVLHAEAIDALDLKPGMTVVDATLGGGGYATHIFEKIQPNGRLIAFDHDVAALERFRARHADYAGQIDLVHSNYAALRIVLREKGIDHVDAIVADLGLSSDQIMETERGFSFQEDGPLDMRMDQTDGRTAADLVATASQDELMQLLRDYAQERYARRIAQAIVQARATQPITTTGQLAAIVTQAVPAAYAHGRIHPATRTFQALRIALNDELNQLRTFLTAAVDLLAPGGRIAVVTFHSGEDKIVKEIFHTHARGCMCPEDFPICQCGQVPDLRLIRRGGITPQEAEIARNPRARSARLRIAEKIASDVPSHAI